MSRPERENSHRLKDGRALRYQNRRAELLDAVVNHLLHNGLNGMSLRSVATAVGVSHVTLLHHFGTREELLVEVSAWIRKREAIPDQLAGDEAEQLIRDLWKRWSKPEGQRVFRLLFEIYGHVLAQPEGHQPLVDGIVSDWIAVIAQLLAVLGLPPSEAERLATRVLAQLRGLQMDLLITGDRDRVNAAFEESIAQWADELARTRH